MGFVKIKNLCTKEYYQESKKQPAEWGKIYANHISGKSLISRIYKELLQTHYYKVKQPNLNKNGQRTSIYIYPKKIQEWPINRDTQHQSLGQCKPKSQ